MKTKCTCLILACLLLLTACAPGAAPEGTLTAQNGWPSAVVIPEENVVEITLEGQDITVEGDVPDSEGTVYISRDIVYYENRTQYASGNPYGEGTQADMHTEEEAAAHLVVNITRPGTYRLRGNLELGQIRVDLGENSKDDPDAVVNLILDGFSVRCDVAPAILFRNVYECDGNRTEKNASPDVDTAAAGANLILAEGSENTVCGSYVAKIYKDQDGEKKLWKQDGAVYSYMSLNVFGPGRLDIDAENEGLGTEMHLTILDGDIRIRSQNDGINTNEDGISVTTILGGTLHIIAGLGEEGDGIDSNGYLVIRDGTVISSAHPASDAGLDSDLGSFIHGGTVIALGSPMDWAESNSQQVTVNLQFSWNQTAGTTILITRENGEALFAYDPARDEALGENAREFSGAVISCPGFAVGDNCQVILGAEIEGRQILGVYDPVSIVGFSGGNLQGYTDTDVMRRPDGFEPGEGDWPPQGERVPPRPPEGNDSHEGKEEHPGGNTFPEGPYGPPEVFIPAGEGNVIFFLRDQVNFFSGIAPALQQAMPIQ